MAAIRHLKLAGPANEKRTVALPVRKPNAAYRSREHLTEREVERLVEVTKDNRWGNRDSMKIHPHMLRHSCWLQAGERRRRYAHHPELFRSQVDPAHRPIHGTRADALQEPIPGLNGTNHDRRPLRAAIGHCSATQITCS
jgi:hypothetical protein